jgi:hypothetical protein
MIDRFILSAVLGTVGWNGLYPEPKPPMTLQQKAKNKSVSAVCNKKKKTKTVQEMCKRWEEHNG